VMITFPTVGWIHDAQRRDGKPSESRQRQLCDLQTNMYFRFDIITSVALFIPQTFGETSILSCKLPGLPPQPSIESRAVR